MSNTTERLIAIKCDCGFERYAIDAEHAEQILSGHPRLCPLNPDRKAATTAAFERAKACPQRKRVTP